MALLGHGGKFTACLAEAEERSPFPPLHTTFGHDAQESNVTVVATEAPHSVLSFVDPGDAGYPDHLLTVLASALSGLHTNNSYVRRGAMVVILNPEHAAALAAAGYDRAALQAELYARARNPRGLLRRLAAFILDDGDAEELLPVVGHPSDFVVLTAGGGGQHSAVAPTWGGGAEGQVPITRKVRLGQSCVLGPSA